MANLIRLKQIESGSALQTSAEIGNDFSQSVINIVQDNIAGTLPDGVVSGSSQIFISGTIGYSDLATDLEVAVISGSIASTINFIASGSGFVTTASFHSYTASLGDTFATDIEVYLTASNIIDQGEF
jgi:hypothetical protein